MYFSLYCRASNKYKLTKVFSDTFVCRKYSNYVKFITL